jgi:hypothetical protein
VSGSLSGPRAKWRRAQAHLETLRQEIPEWSGGWEPPNRYSVTPETHRDGLEYRFYVDPPELDTEGWALLVGDCLFNLRSALDHIVYELHLRHYKGNIPTDAREAPAFPILTVKPDGKHGRAADPAKWNEIKRLGFKQRRAIEVLQPYNRRHHKFRDVRSRLARLQTLNNIDKHRRLHVLEALALTPPVPWWGDSAYGFCQEVFLRTPLVGKTEVFRWTFDTVPPDIAEKANINYEVAPYIALYEGGEALWLTALLTELVWAVGAVITRFAVFLPQDQSRPPG